MQLERDYGFRSSFNFVPERYDVSTELRETLIKHGFEVGVHGLNHDGKLYNSKAIFQERAVCINKYLKEWESVGFRSPAMHHNLEWIHDLDIEYDSSTFDTDPFEPQSDGMGTIFPFWVSNGFSDKGYVELPYTLAQDFTLFVLMKEKTIDIWKQTLDWIVKHGGMALLNTHPDYMKFREGSCKIEEYPIEFYEELLDYVKGKYESQYWNPLPKEMSRFWRENLVEKWQGRQF
jgi:peptidoglycan/xylan/chitin deacetylase (PgdA/CDA1 family)